MRVGVGRPDSTDPEIVSRHVLGRFSEPTRRSARAGGARRRRARARSSALQRHRLLLDRHVARSVLRRQPERQLGRPQPAERPLALACVNFATTLNAPAFAVARFPLARPSCACRARRGCSVPASVRRRRGSRGHCARTRRKPLVREAEHRYRPGRVARSGAGLLPPLPRAGAGPGPAVPVPVPGVRSGSGVRARHRPGARGGRGVLVAGRVARPDLEGVLAGREARVRAW